MIEDIAKTDKKLLLLLARQSIANKFSKAKPPVRPDGSEIFDEPCGAFVTLHKHGSLRGCVGYIEAREELWKTVKEVALLAAFSDNRFPQLKEPELAQCEIEISVLSPFEICDDPEKIEIGKHGLYIRKGFYSGLLLPQVPTEWGWERTEFLEHTCNKAGLPPNAWKEKDTTIFWFTAVVFNESDVNK